MKLWEIGLLLPYHFRLHYVAYISKIIFVYVYKFKKKTNTNILKKIFADRNQ